MLSCPACRTGPTYAVPDDRKGIFTCRCRRLLIQPTLGGRGTWDVTLGIEPPWEENSVEIYVSGYNGKIHAMVWEEFLPAPWLPKRIQRQPGRPGRNGSPGTSLNLRTLALPTYLAIAEQAFVRMVLED